MEAELSTTHTLCGSLSHHKSDDQEMLNSYAGEGPNKANDMQLQQNINNFQVVPDGKWSSGQGQCTKNNKLENNNYLEEKQLEYGGLAGDLIYTSLHQRMLNKMKHHNFSECFSQSVQPYFDETPFGDKSDQKPSSISKFNRKNILFEDRNNSLVLPVTNYHALNKQASVQRASQFEDKVGSSYDRIRDEPGIEERTVPETYMNTTNKASSSFTQKNQTDSTQEVPESYSYSGECIEKWKNIQRFINGQQLIYNGSAGDLIASIHWSNANIPKDSKSNILENVSQPKEDFIHVYTSDKIKSPKNDNVKTAVNHGNPEINNIFDKYSAINDTGGSKKTAMHWKNTEIQSEMHNVISKLSKNEKPFEGRNLKWEDVEKYIKEQNFTYSGFAGELISSTSGMCVRTPQVRQATLRSLSQPTEYVGNKLIKEAMSGEKCNYKLCRDLPFSLHSSTYNTITKDEDVMLPNINMTTAEKVEQTASFISPKISNSNVILQDYVLSEPKNIHINNTMQSGDVLNISKTNPLTGINSCKVLQEQLDQTVPSKENIVEYETNECPSIKHKIDPPQDPRNSSECKSLPPDVFADEDDDISLYADSPENVLADNLSLNADTVQNALNDDKSEQKNENVNEFVNSHLHTANDIPVHKLSENVPKLLKNKENCEINGPINRAEKKADLISFEDESLIGDADYLYASDMFPICLTQPAIPTYLLRDSKSEFTNNNCKVLENEAKTLERCTEQFFQEKIEKMTDSIDIDSSEYENTCEGSCKFTTSKIISCTTPTLSTSLSHQNLVVLNSDTNNYEASQQKTAFSVSSNCDATFEENPTFQNDEMKLNDQLHNTNKSETELKETNRKYMQSYNNADADENSDTQLHLSPMLENSHNSYKAVVQNLQNCISAESNNKYLQTQDIENSLITNGGVLYTANTFKKLDSHTTSVALQNMSILKKQIHAEKTDTGDLIYKPSNNRQSNQIVPVNSISESENCVVAAQQLHGNNTVLTQSAVVDENKCHSIKNHSTLMQRSSSNVSLDDLENLSNEYSLNSAKVLKSQVTFNTMEEDHQVLDKRTDSSGEEYNSDASISEATSESNIDLHIDNAIEKYQNASSGSEITFNIEQDTQDMENSMEVSVQTDIFGLVQVEHCICKKFHLCCEVCNENLLVESENKEKKRQAISSDLEMPLNKKAKYYSQKIQMMNSDINETENKMQITDNIKYTEDIQTINQVYFNKSIMPPQAVTHDYHNRRENKNNHRNVQGVYQHTPLFSLYTAEKSESLQSSQEVSEHEIQQNPKPRVPLRIGLSKRAKTKPLHYNNN